MILRLGAHIFRHVGHLKRVLLREGFFSPCVNCLDILEKLTQSQMRRWIISLISEHPV